MFRPGDLKIATVPQKRIEIYRVSDEDEKKIIPENWRNLDDIFIRDKSDYDRHTVLQRLHVHGLLFCKPDISVPLIVDAKADAKEADDADTKEANADDDVEEASDPANTVKAKKLGIRIQLTASEAVEVPPDTYNILPLTFDDDKNPTLFILCSASKQKQLPGKGSSEHLKVGADFGTLHKIDDWRNLLCNSYASFDLDGATWKNVDHFMQNKKSGSEMYRALYAKFTQHEDLLKVLYHTKNAQLFYRITPKTKVEFVELMILREAMRKYTEYLVEKDKNKDLQKTIAPIKLKKKDEKSPDITAVVVDKSMLARLPPNPRIFPASTYYLNNRAQFVKRMDQVFATYLPELRADTEFSEKFQLLTHQKIVRDYMNLYTPYRGLLLYHGLGSGKTCTSIAIAEGMKSTRPIYVMLPAALRTNFWSELNKCGNEIYKKNQFWEFISTDNQPELLLELAKVLSLSTNYIKQQKGAWMVDARKPANFESLPLSNRASIEQQIQHMISKKYVNIHYNNPHLAKEIKNISKGSNPFNDSVIIIDEAHNFISRIVSKLVKKNVKSIYLQLYKLLMEATNCKIVMLTGTPIINSPHEMAVMSNILRGYIYTWEFPLDKKTNEKVDSQYLEALFRTNRVNTFDYVQIGRENVLSITRNPFGFINKYAKKGTQRRDEYDGIARDEAGNISNDEFVRQVKRILEENGLPMKAGKNPSLKFETNLPDNKDKFVETFLKDASTEMQHANVLRNRLIGMTSYFRSAKEDSLPSFVLDNGAAYHEIMVEMSDYQFTAYAKIRLEEREQEKRRKRQAIQQAGMKDLDKVNSTFRIFSRTCCNFAFPADPGRPHPFQKEEDVEEDERMVEGTILDEERDETDEALNPNYAKRIESVMKVMKEKASEYLSEEGLANYSPKFFKILQKIKSTGGCQLLYSNFRTLEGIGLFKLMLEEHGMIEFRVTKDSRGQWKIADEVMANKGKQRFVLYTGTESEDLKEVVRLIYNNSWGSVPPEILADLRKLATNNLQGDVIKLFMITSAGAEGISLHNTRIVHIMEPYWHNVRLEQVVGRARRINSHAELPMEMRNVTVYIYLSTLSASQRVDDRYKDTILNDVGLVDKDRTLTTDEYLYEVAQLKQKVNNQFLTLLKETAIDCRLYLSKHNKNETLVCYNSPWVESNKYSTFPLIQQDMDEENVKRA